MSESLSELRERLQSDPHSVSAFQALEQALVSAGDYEALIGLYEGADESLREAIDGFWNQLVRKLETAIARESDGARRAELLLAMGKVLEEHAGKPEQAIPAYQKAFRADSNATEALDRSRAIYAQTKNWDMVLRLWELQIRSAGSPAAAADSRVEMARLCLETLDEPERAAKLARQALEEAPEHEGAAAVLKEYDNLMRDWQGEIAQMHAELEGLDEDDRLAGRFAIAEFIVDEVPLKHAQPETLLGELRDAVPDRPGLWSLLERWARRRDKRDEEADALIGRSRCEDAGTAARTLQSAIEAALDSEDDALVLRARRELALRAPQDETNLRRVRDELEHQEAWAELVAVLEAARPHYPDDADLLVELGGIYRLQLADDERADDAYRDALALRPDDVNLLHYFLERYRVGERHEDFVATALSLAEKSDPTEAAALIEEAGCCAEEKLDDPAGAIAAWTMYLELGVPSLPARRALRRLFRKAGDWNALAAGLEAEVARDDERDLVAPRDELYEELIALCNDELNDAERALAAFEGYRATHPNDESLAGRYRDQARVAGKRALSIADLTASVERHPERARELLPELHDDYLADGQERMALETLLTLLERFPDERRHDEAVALADQVSSFSLAWQARSLRAQVQPDSERISALLEQAQWAADRERPEFALKAIETAKQEGATLGGEHAELNYRVLRALERWDELIAAYEAAYEASGQNDVDALVSAAKVYAEELEDDDNAQRQLERALAKDEAHAAAAEALMAVQARRGDWAGLLELARSSAPTARAAWDRVLQGVQEGEIDVALALELQDIAGEVYEEPSRQVVAYELYLAERPDDTAARAGLRELALQEGEQELAAECALELGRRGADDALALLKEAMSTFGETLSMPGRAFEAAADALRLAPDDAALLRELLGYASLSERRQEAGDRLEELRYNGQLAIEGLRELGYLYRELRAGDPIAIPVWEELLKSSPDDREALQALTPLYLQNQQHTALTDVLARRLLHASGPERSDLLRLRAGILHTELGRLDDAADAYHELLQEAPSDQGARRQLEVIYEGLERWQELDEIVSQQLAFAPDEEAAAAILVRRAKLRIAHLDAAEEGERDLANVLTSFPETDAAELSREQIAERVEVAGDHVVRALSGWLRNAGREDELVALLEARVDARQQADLESWRLLVELLRHDPARQTDALHRWEGLLRHEPDNIEGVRALRRYANDMQDEEQLARLWLSSFHSGAIHLWPELSALLADDLDRPEDALPVLRSVRGELSEDPAVRGAYDTLLKRLAAHQERIDWRRNEAESADEERSSQLLLEAAQLAESRLEDHHQAAEIAREALRHQPERDELWTLLLRNLEDGGEELQLEKALEERLRASLSPEDAAQLTARLVRSRLRRGEGLEDAYTRICALGDTALDEPEIRDALRRLAVDDAATPFLVESTAELLFSLADVDPEDRVDVLRARARHASSAEEGADLLRGAATIAATELGDEELAWVLYAEAFEKAPHRPEFIGRLEELAGSLDRWRDFALALADRAEEQRIERPDLAADLFGRAARIETDRLDAPEDAVVHIEAMLELREPTDERLQQLQQLYMRLDRADAVLDVLDRRSALARGEGNADVAAQIAEQAASHAESVLHDTDGALARWAQIAEMEVGEGTKRRAADARRRLLSTDERWDELAELLQELAEHSLDDEERQSLYREAAQIHEEERHDVGAALRLWTAAAGDASVRRIALAELDRLHEERGETDERYEVLRARVADEPENRELKAELHSVGVQREVIAEEDLSGLAALLAGGDTAAELAWKALEDLAARRPDSFNVEAWKHYADYALRIDELALAADANERCAALVESEERSGMLWRAALQMRAAGSDASRAADLAVRAWEAGGGAQDIYDEVIAMVTDAGNWDDFVEAAEGLLERGPMPWLRRELAGIYDEQHPDASRRREHLRQLFEARPQDAALWQQLRELMEPQERIPIDDRRLSVLGDEEERQELRRSIATRAMEYAELRELALQRFQDFRAVNANDEMVNLTMAQLLRELERWDELVLLLDEQLWLVDDSDRRAALLVERARVVDASGSSDAQRADAWLEVLDEAQGHPIALKVLRELLASTDDELIRNRIADRLEAALEAGEQASELAELLEGRLAESTDDNEAVAYLKRLGPIYVEQLHDTERAYRTYTELLRREPTTEEWLQRSLALSHELEDDGLLLTALDDALRSTSLSEDLRRRLERARLFALLQHSETQAEALEALGAIVDDSAEDALIDEVLLRLQGSRARRAEWLEARAAAAMSDAERRDTLLRRAADAWLEEPAEPGRAGALEAQRYTVHPSMELALRVDQLLETASSWHERAAFWRQRFEARDDFELDVIEKDILAARTYQALSQADASDDEQVAVIEEWARVAPAEPRLAQAVAHLAERWQRSPEDDSLAARLTKLADETRQREVAESLFASRVQSADVDTADALWRARIETMLEDGEARQAWDAAIAALRDDASRSARAELLEAVAAQTGRDEEAAAQLRHFAETGPLHLLVRAARLDLHRLRLYDRGIDALAEVLRHDPANDAARKELQQLVQSDVRAAARLHAVEVLAESALDEREAAAAWMLAAVAASEDNDDALAVQHASRALETDPDYTPARSMLVELSGQPELALRAGRRLAPVLREDEAYPELAVVLDRMVSAELPRSERHAIARELGEIYETQLRQRSNASRAWLIAAESQRGDFDAFDAAARCIADREDAARFAAAVQRTLPSVAASSQQARLLAHVGRAELEHMGEREDGEARLKQALELDPSCSLALDGLEGLYVEEQNYDGLAQVLELQWEATSEREQARTLLSRTVAILRGDLGQPAAALALLKRAERRFGAEGALLEEIETVAREAGDSEQVVAALCERARLDETDLDERAELLLKAARGAAAELGDRRRAATICREVLADDDANIDALALLEWVLDPKEDARERAELQRKLLAMHPDDEHRARMAHALAQQCAAGVVRPAQLLEALNEANISELPLGDWLDAASSIFRTSPGAELRREWAYLAMDMEHWPRPAVQEALAAWLDVADENEIGTSTLARMEALFEEEAEGSAHARARGRALIAEAQTDWDTAVDRWSESLAACEDDIERARILLRIGRIEEYRRANPEVALPLYEDALARGLQSDALFESLERLYKKMERWPILREMLEMQASVAEPPKSVELLLRSARLSLDELDDQRGALETLERAAALSPGDVSVQLMRLETLLQQQRFDEAGALASALQNEGLRRQQRHDLEVMMGMAAIEKGAWAEARAWLEAAREHAASDGRTLLALGRCLIGEYRWAEALEVLQAALVNQDRLGTKEKALTFALTARCRLELGDVDRARESAMRAERLSAGQKDARSVLEDPRLAKR